MHKPAPNAIWGLAAEFEDITSLVHACKKAHAEGFKNMDAYSPFPSEDIMDAMHHHKSVLPRLVLGGGITGCLFGFGMQYYVNVFAYPLNIGGKPLNSWPAFIPITFECTVLFAALTCVMGLLLLNGYPRHYHPVFNVKNFDRVSQDRFFLIIESTDSKFDRNATEEFLKSLNPVEVNEVEN
jgi:hypothetical protein